MEPFDPAHLVMNPFPLDPGGCASLTCFPFDPGGFASFLMMDAIADDQTSLDMRRCADEDHHQPYLEGSYLCAVAVVWMPGCCCDIEAPPYHKP